MKFWLIFGAALLALALGFGLLIWAAVWAVWAMPSWARTVLLALASGWTVYKLVSWLCAPMFDDVEFDIDDKDYEGE